MILASFCFFLLCFVVIGVLSYFKSAKSSSDYLLTGQNTKPWLVALSAVATCNSGYMFVGQIGFTYTVGLQSIWLMIGWITGDFISSLFVHKRLRTQSETHHNMSFATAISGWQGFDMKYLRILGGIITIAFLGTYAAAQLNAGSKALNVLFGWEYGVGAMIGAVIVLLYCLAGGLRASIWTDAAQSFVMFTSMILMAVVAIMETGGLSEFIIGLNNVSPDYMNVFPDGGDYGPWLGVSLFLLGWFFAGIGVVGQPPIMVRFMAMDNPDSMNRARFYYYFWYSSFYALTIIAALAARLLIPDANEFDPELALPKLAMELLPEILVGLILAGLFAATMSTADSQILCCTASITNDIAPGKLNHYMINKFATFGVTAIALLIALYGSDNVFALVLIAWAGLGSCFAPLIIVLALGRKLSEATAILMIVTGFGTMMAWRTFGDTGLVYEIFPGIATGLLTYIIVQPLLTRGKSHGTNGDKA